jgi:hypothetical protein
MKNFEMDMDCDCIMFVLRRCPNLHLCIYGTHTAFACLDSRNSHPAHQENQRANKRGKVVQIISLHRQCFPASFTRFHIRLFFT